MIATTKVSVSATDWTDLGPGPLTLQTSVAPILVAIGDTKPAATDSGFTALFDVPSIHQTLSHVWVKVAGNGASVGSVIVAPVTSAVGNGYAQSGKPPLAGTIAAAGATGPFVPLAGRGFNISLWGTFAAVTQLERSFDGGTTWLPITAAGTQLFRWTAPASESDQDDETGVLYRLNCTSYTSGTVNYRVSQ